MMNGRQMIIDLDGNRMLAIGTNQNGHQNQFEHCYILIRKKILLKSNLIFSLYLWLLVVS